MRSRKFGHLGGSVTLILGITLVTGCGKGTTVSLPQLTPIVKAALPSGLKPGGTRSIHWSQERQKYTSSTTLAQAYIQAVFQNYFVNGSTVGGPQNVQGYILNQVAIVDGRTSLYDGETTKNNPCLGNTPKTYTLDFSSFNPSDTTSPNMLKFTLNQVQCSAAFSSPANGSGEIFGTSGSSASVWVSLTDMAGDNVANGGVFINAANVSDAGATDQAVDGLAVSYSPSQTAGAVGNISVSRYKAQPSTNKFEMYFASSTDSVGGFASATGGGNGSPNYLGAGFRMISDGVDIYADGTLCNDNGGSTCNVDGNWVPFFVCMDATTLAVVDPTTTTNCVTLANAFTLSTVPTTITAGSFTSFTSPNVFTAANMTGVTALGQLGTLNALATGFPLIGSIVSTLQSDYAITNASSVTSGN